MARIPFKPEPQPEPKKAAITSKELDALLTDEKPKKEFTEAHRKANKKWNDANLKERYDRLQIVLPKGQGAKIKKYANERGESVGGFVKRAITTQILIDKQDN